MINITSFSKVLEKILIPYVERNIGMVYSEIKKDLLEYIKEYKRLNNRFWKRKRELREIIFSEVLWLEEFIEKMEVPDMTPSEWKKHKKNAKD